MVVPMSESGIVFLSGGIGITPARSVIRDLQYRNSRITWSLLHVSRSDFLYEKELVALNNIQWRTNRIGIETLWQQVVNQPSGTRYYLSGSERFVTGMKERLALSGIGAQNVITESFY